MHTGPHSFYQQGPGCPRGRAGSAALCPRIALRLCRCVNSGPTPGGPRLQGAHPLSWLSGPRPRPALLTAAASQGTARKAARTLPEGGVREAEQRREPRSKCKSENFKAGSGYSLWRPGLSLPALSLVRAAGSVTSTWALGSSRLLEPHAALAQQILA